jgi:membrane-bound serine protease (ClpP class)
MIGRIGIAIENFHDLGRISVNGEIWQAESDSKIQQGETVKIVEMSGLTLIVEKV